MSAHGKKSITKDQIWLGKGSLWAKLPILGVILAAVGLGGSYSMMGEHPQEFWYAYLTALAVFIAFGLGGLFFVIIQHVTRAGWSIVVRRLAENVMITLPALALLCLPVIFMGAHDLYEWTHLEVVANDPMLSEKQPYLNEAFFTQRMFAYFGIWTLLSVLFYRWSTAQDEAQGPRIETLAHRMRWLSAPGVLLFALSMTFFAFDALMSLDPHWFSTMFGVYYFAGIAVTSHAMLALVSIGLRQAGYLKGVVTEEHNHDLGKLMFGFTVFFAYIGFSQYFLIWYANIPEETRWFAYRISGDFLYLSGLLALGRFVIPFFFLLPRVIKRGAGTLFVAAAWILFMQIVDMYWLVQPVLANHHAKEHGGGEPLTMHVGALDVLTLVGVGGVFLAVFGWALKRKALVPVNDPRLQESLHFENF